MKLKRTTMVITQRCTLKCKLCLAFMPYYENPKDMTLEEVNKILVNYFKLVDEVGTFSITGGEPLMHKDMANIMKMVYKYSDQIKEHIDIVTNGTIPFGDELIKTLYKNKENTRVIISDYGKFLSKNIDIVVKQLEENNITYRIQSYADEDKLLYDGWVDFTDHSLKHKTEQEVLKQANRCIFRRGHYYVINEGELHPCSRSYWRMRINVIKKDEMQYINLLNQTDKELDKNRKCLEHIEKLIALNSCAYCSGVYNGIKRFKPAEQLE